MPKTVGRRSEDGRPRSARLLWRYDYAKGVPVREIVLTTLQAQTTELPHGSHGSSCCRQGAQWLFQFGPDEQQSLVDHDLRD